TPAATAGLEQPQMRIPPSHSRLDDQMQHVEMNPKRHSYDAADFRRHTVERNRYVSDLRSLALDSFCHAPLWRNVVCVATADGTPSTSRSAAGGVAALADGRIEKRTSIPARSAPRNTRRLRPLIEVLR